jgi:tRNA A-37 threonylcarbamoyl transferase component Bud32
VPTAVVAIAGVIVRNHLAVEDPAQRRRLRWVFLGSIAAATPFVVLFVSDLIGSLVGVEVEYFAWLRAQAIVELFLIFLPVTFTYAVVANRVVGVEVVVRRGLRYLLAKNVLRAAVFFPLVAIAVSVVRNPDRTVMEMAVQNPFIAGLAIAAAVGLSARERLNRWLDRRFFRDASERDRLLLDLVHALAHRDDPSRVEMLVVERVEQALHPHSVRLVFDDESRWPAAALVIPIPGREEQVIGALLLGDKRSDEPYSREDRRLLEAVAAQVGVVRENASLRRTAADDARVKQEVLARLAPGRFNLLKECSQCGRCYDQSADTCEHDGQALSFAVPVDRTIDGKYRLEQLLGRGGMGAVYAATDVRLGRLVAVKLLRDTAFTNDDLRRRFHREARACARLRHDNIITVYDYGTTGYDVAYLVMEKLAGSTLRAELHRRPQLTAHDVAGWFEQILEGVCCAHAAGVIHRDLKPENVFVRRPGESSGASITLLDFGLAKLTLEGPDQSRSLTTPGAVMGTLAYMSPEQLLGGTVDERTDLFSIGVMALEAVSGRNPFSRAHPQDTVAAILHERAGLSGADPGTATLDAVIQRCIAKDREQRFASAREMQRELIPALRACELPGPAHTPADPGDDVSTTA